MATRPRLVLAFVVLLAAPVVVRAQPQERSAAVQRTGPVDTSALKVDKLKEEVRKLRNEAQGLEDTNEALGRWTRRIAALGGVGVLATLLVALAGYFFNRTQHQLGRERHLLESRKIEQDRVLGREKHMLEVFQALGSSEARIRIGAVAVLVQRLERISALRPRASSAMTADSSAEEQLGEVPTIVSVLISVTKHEPTKEIQKYIADGLAKSLRAFPKDGTLDPGGSPLAPYDFQGAKLQNAWWKGIDARGVDFYGACLVRAGLRNSFLQGAVLKGADLTGATLSGARLDGADLQGTKLKGAKLAKSCLVGAKLQRARLAGADLSGSDLTDADLTDADLTGANLTGVDLTGAVLRGAKLDGAVLPEVRPDPAALSGVDPGNAVLGVPSTSSTA